MMFVIQRKIDISALNLDKPSHVKQTQILCLLFEKQEENLEGLNQGADKMVLF